MIIWAVENNALISIIELITMCKAHDISAERL